MVVFGVDGYKRYAFLDDKNIILELVKEGLAVARFSPEDYYSNKTVRIKGEIKEYQGKPEIILENPSQIEIGK